MFRTVLPIWSKPGKKHRRYFAVLNDFRNDYEICKTDFDHLWHYHGWRIDE